MIKAQLDLGGCNGRLSEAAVRGGSEALCQKANPEVRFFFFMFSERYWFKIIIIIVIAVVIVIWFKRSLRRRSQKPGPMGPPYIANPHMPSGIFDNLR